jgi:hypothetical protein
MKNLKPWFFTSGLFTGLSLACFIVKIIEATMRTAHDWAQVFVILGFVFLGIALLILVVLLVDLFFTLQKLVDFKGTLQHIKEFGEYLKIHYGNEDWFKNNSLSDLIATVKQQHQPGKKEINSNLLDKLDKIQEKHPVVENFIHKFPTLKSRKYPESLQLLKNKFLKK